MRTYLVALSLITAAALLVGCTTQFYGEPTFPRGARGCWDRCQADGLEMSAFVYMGEYSSGCVCRVRTSGDVAPAPTTTPAMPASPNAVPPAPPAPEADVQASVSAGMAAVAVMAEQARMTRSQ